MDCNSMKQVPAKKVSNFRLYFKILSLGLRATMEYRSSFIMSAISQFLASFSVFFGMMFMFMRFSSVDGFTFEEVLICFSSINISFALAECFVRGLDQFPAIISNGQFDRILVRPRGEIFQVITSKFEFSRLGRLLQAIIIFCWSLPRCGISFTLDKILCLSLMVICGACIFGGIFTIYAFICFFTTEGLEFMNILTDGMREYGKYPLGIYGKKILFILTFIFPFALVQYYPFLYLTGRNGNIFYMLLPLISLVFLVPCGILWKIGVRHYRSTGS